MPYCTSNGTGRSRDIGNPTGRLTEYEIPTGTTYMEGQRLTIQGTETDLRVTRVTNDVWGNRYEFEARVGDFSTVERIQNHMRTGVPMRVTIDHEYGTSLYEGRVTTYTIRAENMQPATIIFELHIQNQVPTESYPVLGSEHRCYQCNKPLFFGELQVANRRIDVGKLEELWDNPDVQFLCCNCHRRRSGPEESQRQWDERIREAMESPSRPYVIGTPQERIEWQEITTDSTSCPYTVYDTSASTPIYGVVSEGGTADLAYGDVDENLGITGQILWSGTVQMADRCDPPCNEPSVSEELIWQGTYASNRCKICGGTHAFYNDNTCFSCRRSKFRRLKYKLKRLFML